MAVFERSADLAVVGANGGGFVTDFGINNLAVPEGLLTPTSEFKALGAISNDGLTYGFDEDQEQFTPWGLTAPFRTETTSSVRTFGCVLWETNRPSVKSVFYRLPFADATPDADGLYSFAETASPSPDRRAWIFDVVDGQTMERFYVPEGEISDRSDVTFQNSEMAGYEITVTAYPDGDGNTVYHIGRVAIQAS